MEPFRTCPACGKLAGMNSWFQGWYCASCGHIEPYPEHEPPRPVRFSAPPEEPGTGQMSATEHTRAWFVQHVLASWLRDGSLPFGTPDLYVLCREAGRKIGYALVQGPETARPAVYQSLYGFLPGAASALSGSPKSYVGLLSDRAAQVRCRDVPYGELSARIVLRSDYGPDGDPDGLVRIALPDGTPPFTAKKLAAAGFSRYGDEWLLRL